MKRQQAGLLGRSTNPLLQSSLSPVSNPMASFPSYLSIFEVTLPHHHGNPEKLGWGWQKGECALPPAACQLSERPKAGFTGCLQLVGRADERGHLKPPAGKVQTVYRENAGHGKETELENMDVHFGFLGIPRKGE